MTASQRQYLIDNGLDPTAYEITPDGQIVSTAPEEVGKLPAFMTGFAKSVLPTAAAIGSGALAGGALSGPAAPIGAIVGGLAGGFAAGKAQDAVLDAVAPSVNEFAAKAQRDQPVFSYLGGFAPNALALKPDIRGAKALLNPLMGMKGTQAFNRSAINVGANVAGSTAGQLVDMAQGGEFSLPRFAADVALGSLYNDPTKLGKRLGLAADPVAPTPARMDLEATQIPLVVDKAIAETQAMPTDPAAKPVALEPLAPDPEQVGVAMVPDEKDYAKFWRQNTETDVDLLKGIAEREGVKLSKKQLAVLAEDPGAQQIMRGDYSRWPEWIATKADEALDFAYGQIGVLDRASAVQDPLLVDQMAKARKLAEERAPALEEAARLRGVGQENMNAWEAERANAPKPEPAPAVDPTLNDPMLAGAMARARELSAENAKIRARQEAEALRAAEAERIAAEQRLPFVPPDDPFLVSAMAKARELSEANQRARFLADADAQKQFQELLKEQEARRNAITQDDLLAEQMAKARELAEKRRPALEAAAIRRGEGDLRMQELERYKQQVAEEARLKGVQPEDPELAAAQAKREKKLTERQELIRLLKMNADASNIDSLQAELDSIRSVRKQRDSGEDQPMTQEQLNRLQDLAAQRGIKVELKPLDGARGVYVAEGDDIRIIIDPLKATVRTLTEELSHDVFGRTAAGRVKKGLVEAAMDGDRYKAEVDALKRERANGENKHTDEEIHHIALEEGFMEAFTKAHPDVPPKEILSWWKAFKGGVKAMAGMKMKPEEAMAWMNWAIHEGAPWSPGAKVSATRNQRDGAMYFESDSLKKAENTGSKSREILVYMSPEEFLAVAAPLKNIDPDKAKGVLDLLKQNKQFSSLPYLSFEHDGKGTAQVVSHEGRHRALALRERGIKEMPVILQSRNSKKGDEIRWGEQSDEQSYDRIKQVWPTVLKQESSAGKNKIVFPVSDLRTTPNIRHSRDPLAAPLDKLESMGPEQRMIGQGYRAAYNTKDFMKGQWRSKIEAVVPKLSPEQQEALIRHTYEENDTGLNKAPRADLKEAYDAIRQNTIARISQDAQAAGHLIKGPNGYRPRGQDPSYFPAHRSSTDVREIFSRPERAAERAQKQAEFMTWTADQYLKKNPTKTVDEANAYAADKLEREIGIMQGRPQDIDASFAGASKPEGVPLPPSWRSMDLMDVLNNYIDRSATDFAYKQHIESNPAIMAMGGHKTFLNGAPIPQPILQQYGSLRMLNEPLVQGVVREFNGIPNMDQGKLMASASRVVSNAALGPLSKASDTLSTLFKGLAYTPMAEWPSAVVQFADKLSNFTATAERSYASGLNRRDAAAQLKAITGTADLVAGKMDKMAEMIAKAQMLPQMEQLSRTVAQAWGEVMIGSAKRRAMAGDAEAGKFLDSLSVDWRTRSDLDLAAQAGRLLQGTYDMRSVPAWMLQGGAAPFLIWSKWSAGQYNNFRKYAIEPLMRGNPSPLIGQLIIGLTGGAAVGQVREWLNGREDKDINWSELASWADQHGADADFAEVLTGKLVNTMQTLGTFGFAGDLIKSSLEPLNGGQLELPAHMPFGNFSVDLTKRVGAALKALDEGEDAGEIMKALAKDVARSNLQLARVADNWIDEDASMEANDKRRQKFFDVLSGAAGSGNTFAVSYSNVSDRAFDKAEVEDAGTIAGNIITEAATEATSQEDLEQRIRKLKTRQIGIMPNPDRDPVRAAEYLRWLEGAEEGSGASAQGRYEERKRETLYKQAMIDQLAQGL